MRDRRRRRRGRNKHHEEPEYQGEAWPSLREVMDGEWAWVVELARRRGVAHGECQDVALEVFRRYERFRATIASPAAIVSWLRTTAVRVAYHFRNGAIARHEIPFDPGELEHEGIVASAEEELTAIEEEREILAMVDDLESDRREVFRRYVIEEQSIHEIAEALAVVEPTAYNRLRLAREDLRALLGQGRATVAGRRVRPVRGRGSNKAP